MSTLLSTGPGGVYRQQSRGWHRHAVEHRHSSWCRAEPGIVCMAGPPVGMRFADALAGRRSGARTARRAGAQVLRTKRDAPELPLCAHQLAGRLAADGAVMRNIQRRCRLRFLAQYLNTLDESCCARSAASGSTLGATCVWHAAVLGARPVPLYLCQRARARGPSRSRAQRSHPGLGQAG